jgi:formyl-CoA transferase
VGVSIGDSTAGLYGAFGAVMTLFAQDRSAIPIPLVDRVIDVALNESVLSMMESLVPDHLAYGATRHRTGGRMEGIAPSNAYDCPDARSVVAAGNGDAIFRRFMTVIDRADLGQRKDLQDNAGRWTAREELDDVIGGWTAARCRDQVLVVLADAGIRGTHAVGASGIVRQWKPFAFFSFRMLTSHFGMKARVIRYFWFTHPSVQSGSPQSPSCYLAIASCARTARGTDRVLIYGEI